MCTSMVERLKHSLLGGQAANKLYPMLDFQVRKLSHVLAHCVNQADLWEENDLRWQAGLGKYSFTWTADESPEAEYVIDNSGDDNSMYEEDAGAVETTLGGLVTSTSSSQKPSWHIPFSTPNRPRTTPPLISTLPSSCLTLCPALFLLHQKKFKDLFCLWSTI